MDATVKLQEHQEEALERLFSGAILLGDTGSGKTYTSLFFYKNNYISRKLYVITTAKKRDNKDFEEEANNSGIDELTVDSWQNISKYKDVSHAFFIFDEQRVSGYGKWSKTFIHIAKNNDWILLTATPGDVWKDYIPVFIANGFYKNKTDFTKQHIEYNPYVNFPQIRKYHNIPKLIRNRDRILVKMPAKRHTNRHRIFVPLKNVDIESYNSILKDRWNEKENRPIRNASELLVEVRKEINANQERIDCAKFIISAYNKIIVFYNFDYELQILKDICKDLDYPYFQWNGHTHEEIPDTGDWVYLVQYISGSEAWNCIETDTILFYSLNYSYRTIRQAEGRIDRLNTEFTDLYYYYLYAPKTVDDSIIKAIKNKRNFNIKTWGDKYGNNTGKILPETIN